MIAVSNFHGLVNAEADLCTQATSVNGLLGENDHVVIMMAEWQRVDIETVLSDIRNLYIDKAERVFMESRVRDGEKSLLVCFQLH